MHILVLMFAANTWGYAFFNFGEWPKWADTTAAPTNASVVCYPVDAAATTAASVLF